MICKKSIICFTLFSCFFFSLFFSSSSVSATSVTCNLDTSLINGNRYYDFSSVCDTSSLDSSKHWSYTIHFENGISSWHGNFALAVFTLQTNNSESTTYTSLPFFSSIARASYIDNMNFSNTIFDESIGSHFSYLNLGTSGSYEFTKFSIFIDDSYRSCPVCEECQQCPVVPENPYDDKLDNITKAIYVCGAVLLVIYFFYCIYRVIIHSLGGR